MDLNDLKIFVPVIIGIAILLGVLVYYGKKTNRARRSLQELACGFEGTDLKKTIMQGDSLEGQHHGVLFTCHYSPGSKNSPPSMTIRANIPCPAKLTIRREAWYDRFARRIGLVTEIQTGDPAFDQAYYLDTDHASVIMAYFAEEAKRRAVDALFSLGYPVRKIVFGKTHLQLVLSPFPKDAIAALPLKQYLDEIRKLSGEQSYAGYAASFNQSLFPGNLPQPLSRAHLILLFILNGLLIAGGAVLLGLGMSEYETLGHRLILNALSLSVAAALFYLFVVFFRIRGRSSSHLYFLIILILSLVGFPLGFIGGALTTNGIFDQGAETSHRVQVSRLYYQKNKSSRTYYVIFPSWRKPDEIEKISVPAKLYRVLYQGGEIIVKTRPGYWREEWIVHIEPAAESAKRPDASGGYPIRLKSIRFFESGAMRAQDKHFATAFPRETSRYINCQINMENNYWNVKDQSYNFVWHYINPDGSTRGKTSYPFTVRSEWQGAWVVSNWGWEKPGNWPAGNYRVVVYVNGLPFGEGRFIIR